MRRCSGDEAISAQGLAIGRKRPIRLTADCRELIASVLIASVLSGSDSAGLGEIGRLQRVSRRTLRSRRRRNARPGSSPRNWHSPPRWRRTGRLRTHSSRAWSIRRQRHTLQHCRHTCPLRTHSRTARNRPTTGGIRREWRRTYRQQTRSSPPCCIEHQYNPLGLRRTHHPRIRTGRPVCSRSRPHSLLRLRRTRRPRNRTARCSSNPVSQHSPFLETWLASRHTRPTKPAALHQQPIV